MALIKRTALLLGIMLLSLTVKAQTFKKGDTVVNKSTKLVYIIDSAQTRNKTLKNWTTKFWCGIDIVTKRYVEYIPEKMLVHK